jgi:hypothetical protein
MLSLALREHRISEAAKSTASHPLGNFSVFIVDPPSPILGCHSLLALFQCLTGNSPMKFKRTLQSLGS